MTLDALFTLHAAPSVLAIGFSILLVLSLVAAEEVEMRRGAAVRADDEQASQPVGIAKVQPRPAAFGISFGRK